MKAKLFFQVHPLSLLFIFCYPVADVLKVSLILFIRGVIGCTPLHGSCVRAVICVWVKLKELMAVPGIVFLPVHILIVPTLFH